jgi:hypothetical protein
LVSEPPRALIEGILSAQSYVDIAAHHVSRARYITEWLPYDRTVAVRGAVSHGFPHRLRIRGRMWVTLTDSPLDPDLRIWKPADSPDARDESTEQKKACVRCVY